MPIYEYKCPQHGRFEHFGHMAGCSEPRTCPDCGGLSERAVSAFGFVFLTPTIVLQELTQREGGGYKQVGKITNSPATEPPRPPAWDRNLVEV